MPAARSDITARELVLVSGAAVARTSNGTCRALYPDAPILRRVDELLRWVYSAAR
jgi:hypothetical protein